MTIIYNEKQAPLTIADYDVNFTEIRDVITLVNSQVTQTNTLNDDIDDVVQIINNIDNNHLKASNNLSDLQNISNSLLNLEVFSKTSSDNRYFETTDDLSDVDPAQTRQNIEIGNNALREINFYQDTQETSPANTGNDGDLFYNLGIFDGFVYDGKSLLDNTDNQVMNFNKTDGTFYEIKDLPNFSLTKTLFNDQYIFGLGVGGTYDYIYAFNKDNLNDYTTISDFTQIKDFDVVTEYNNYVYNGAFGSQETIIGALITSDNTFADGVIKYITKSFRTIAVNYGLNTEYNTETQNFNNIVFDAKYSEMIYLTTENYLIKINLKDDINGFIKYEERFSLDTQPSRNSTVCAVDDTYFYYLSTSNLTDVYRINKTTGAISLYHSFSNNVLKIIPDSNNNLYFLTNGALIKRDSQNNEVWSYSITLPTPANVDFDISYNNEIFIGGSGAIIKLDENKNEIFVKNEPGRLLNNMCLFPGKFTQGFWDKGV